MADELIVNSSLSIPVSELSFRFSRSGGPGGQNVNKVSTRVEVRFNVRESPSLSEAQRHRLLLKLQNRLDDEGVLQIQVDESRSQWQNRQIAMERLVEVMRDGLKVPRRRVPTKRTAAANSRRLQAKKRHGELKRGRRGGGDG
jgi:ribosome-associated protein